MKTGKKMIDSRIFNTSFNYIYMTLQDSEEEFFKANGYDDINCREVYHIVDVINLGKCTMKELAKVRHITPGTLTFVVNSLVERGYLKKERNASDKRITHVIPTQKARKIAKLHYMFHDYYLEEIFNRIDVDPEEMSANALAVVEILDEVRDSFNKKYGAKK